MEGCVDFFSRRFTMLQKCYEVFIVFGILQKDVKKIWTIVFRHFRKQKKIG